MKSAVGKLEKSPAMKVKELYDFVSPTFPGEAKMKLESEPKLGNLKFKSGREVLDHQDRDKAVVKYTSTKNFLIDSVETERNVKYSMGGKAMDICLAGGWGGGAGGSL